jgi:arylsulfatase A-like enzyme
MNPQGGSTQTTFRTLVACVLWLIFPGLSIAAALETIDPSTNRLPATQPNVVLILFDDTGFSDFSSYGGEARMPVIDALAARGAMLTQYRTSPLCSPSRAMLLTGVDNHQTGVATIPEVLPPEHAGKPGYAMHLEPGVTTLATRLQRVGYRTFMTGKWHLGDGDGQLPVDHGFDRSFILDASGADNWEDKSYMPYYREAPWYEDDQPVDLPDDVYSADFLTDTMLRYLQASSASDKPFLAYIAYQAVHIPVQAPRDLTEHYAGVYDRGWHALQESRLARLKSMGLVAAKTTPPPMPKAARDWSSLDADAQALAARSMAVHAAMLEAVDQNVGKLVSYLESTGELANTVFIVTSDNGPEPSAPADQPGFETWMSWNGYSRQLDTLGERGSMNYIGREWALATSTPGSLFKFYASEGGIHVPMIMAGPGIPAGQRLTGNAYVTDVTPTLLEITGTAVLPADFAAGEKGMSGRSLVPMLSGSAPSVYGDDEGFGVEVSGNSAFIVGHHKLVRNLAPFGDGAWHLFDLETDPGETTDLGPSQPELLRTMLDRYGQYSIQMGVLAVPEGYSSARQVGANTVRRMIINYAVELVVFGLALIAAFVLLVRAVRRRRPGTL